MNRDEIYTTVKELLISEFQTQADLISPEKLLYDELDLDSLDAVDLLVCLKDRIAGNLDPALFKNARTVQDIINILLPLWQVGVSA
jgi:acyl carrier protein